MNSALPSADLSSSFGKSKRAEGISPPPARPPRSAARKTPAVPADQTDAQPDAQTPDQSADQAAVDASQDVQEAPQRPERPTRGSRAAQEPQRASQRAAALQESPKVTPPAPRRRGRPPTAAAATSTNGARLVLWTPVSIRTRMQAVRNQRGTLYLDQVLDALESTVDELPDLVHQATSAPVVQGRLFERASSTAIQSDERRVQLTINGFLQSHIEVIDDLVGSTGAPSRSALINAALDATLPEL